MAADRSAGRAARLAGGVLLMLVLAGCRRAGTGEDGLAGWRWQPYGGGSPAAESTGLPTFASVTAVAAQPDGPLLYAASYEPPGLWRSSDEGRSWAADDRGLEGSPVYALHWDAARRRWWAGARDGLFARSDADGAWQAVGLAAHGIQAIAGDGRGGLTVATEDGLFRSADAATWQALPIAGMQPGTAILDVDVSWDGDVLIVGAAGQGAWISRDGGADWSPAVDPSTATGRTLAEAIVSAVLLEPAAACFSTTDHAYRSADGGATWQPLAGAAGRVHAFAAGADGAVYAALTGQVARSSDGGLTWTMHGTGLRPGERVLDVAVAPADPAVVFAAAGDGLYASGDGGQTWERRSEGLGHPDANVLAWDGSDRLLVGTRAGLFRRAADDAAWEAVPDIQGRPVLAIAAKDRLGFYAGCTGGLFRSTDGGETWAEIASELSDDGIAGLVVDSGGAAPRQPREAAQVKPAGPDRLLAWVAFGRVHESTDGGLTWATRWEGLGTVRPVTAIHRTRSGALYVGAEDGIFRWEPTRREWRMLPFPLPDQTVFVVASDARAGDAVYAGATDGLWRSPDGGETWRRWGAGLESKTVTALAISPVDPRTAFAGTRHMGLYATADGGETWKPVRAGPPATASVRSIVFGRDGASVYAAGDRGIWQGMGHEDR